LSKAAPVAAFLGKPLREMVRLACPGAHPLGAHVEQVRRLGRRVSDAAPCSPAAVDQCRPDPPPRKLRCEDRARGAAADNRDRYAPVRSRSQARPPGSPRRPGGGSYGRTYA
jgi:hypothetical protein